MFDFIPQPWRDRLYAVFVIGFVLAFIGRKVGVAAKRRAELEGRPVPRWARVLIEIGPGVSAVADHVGPALPQPYRAALDSLRDTDPPAAGGGR